jgi:asparagine synthase (glutamine-hydrolysing)
MTATMALRGPDAGGTWIDVHVGLGHRRLAVIDLAGGAQPMVASDGGSTNAAISYSGEVFNFVDLRQELQRLGHEFTTRSDTEVVLRGYLEWGDEVAERLNGMFAFALWDTRTEELLLIRDRMGIKPLYYYPTKDGVLFGSEPKAILAHPSVQPRVNREGFRELLVLAKNPERTVYAGMFEVRPGQIARVSRQGIRKRNYWMLSAHEHEHDLRRTISTIAELLDDTLRRQTISDVPLCSLLSGGLDSSAMTAIAQRAVRQQTGGRLRSFSVDFAKFGADFVPNPFHGSPDAPFVRDFVAHTGCDHTEILLDSEELANTELNRAVIHASDFPLMVSGDMYVSLYRFFQIIRTKSTVALSGESADELFGGYPWFHDPRVIRAPMFPWMTIAGGWGDAVDVLDPALLAQLNLPGFLRDSYSQAIAEIPIRKGENPLEGRMRQISYLHLTRLTPFLLDRKDRMSMAVGLEVRVPFCDHRLVEYTFNVPWNKKTYDGREKSLLRAATRGLLPQSIIDRRKSPYPSTQDPSYEKGVRSEVGMILANPSHPATHLLNRKVIREMLDRPLGATSCLANRVGLERVRSLGRWVSDYNISLDL